MESNAIKMKFADWARLPRPYRAQVAGQRMVLVTRRNKSHFVRVEIVG